MAKEEQMDFEAMMEGAEVPDELPSALVPAEQPGAALATYSSDLDFDRDEILLPRLRLAQGLTQEVSDGEAKVGQWILSGYEPEDEITIVPLMFARMREFRADDENQTVLCQAPDGKVGVGEPGGDCKKCPLSKWTDNPGKDTNNPPACTLIYSYFVYVTELETVATLDFKRTGINVGKRLNTMVAQRGLGRFAVKLGSNEMKKGRQKWSQPTIHPVKVEPDVLEAARDAVDFATR